MIAAVFPSSRFYGDVVVAETNHQAKARWHHRTQEERERQKHYWQSAQEEHVGANLCRYSRVGQDRALMKVKMPQQPLARELMTAVLAPVLPPHPRQGRGDAEGRSPAR